VIFSRKNHHVTKFVPLVSLLVQHFWLFIRARGCQLWIALQPAKEDIGERENRHGEGAHHECDNPDEDKKCVGGELLFQG